jgi:hypothetical protein
MAAAEAPVAPQEEAAGKVRILGARAFVLADGAWTDTSFDPDTMETVEVAFLSDDYFALVDASPDLGAAFALGEQVIAVVDGVAYQVLPQGSPVSPVQIPPTPAVPTQAGSSPDRAATTTPEAGRSPSVTPDSSASSPAFGQGLPCLGGLLPLIIVPLFVSLRRKR